VPAPAFSQETFMGLTVEPESSTIAYSRREYGGWIDADRDGQNTRQEVLQEESVLGFVWLSPYTGKLVSNSRLLDIDHMVPLAEAHRSGGHAWNRERKRDYANDLNNLDHLIAVSASANRSKGSKDPAKWMPPNRAYWCKYLIDWVVIKLNYSLTIDHDEKLALEKGFDVCSSYLIRDSLSEL
jgi:hypothetical protein